jgi:hypothetical protein
VHLRLLSYISSIFIILLAVITVFYELSETKSFRNPVKMYPYFDDIRHKINKIDIRFPNTSMSLVRQKDAWIVTTADNFPANTAMIDRLYQDIHNLELIDSKTQHSSYFYKINLLNPNQQEKIDGEGIRISLMAEDNKPYVDFIAGERLNSYVNQNSIRLFTRYGVGDGAFLAQTTTDFQYQPSQFLSSEFGMPKIEDIVSMNLTVKENSILKLYHIIDQKDFKKIMFMPAAIPRGKKLIYPLVMRDYMMALINQLKPIDAMTVPFKQSITDVSIALELTRGRLVKINFWHVKNAYYMRILGGAVQSVHNNYIYHINKADYEAFIQPLDKFLITDTVPNASLSKE